MTRKNKSWLCSIGLACAMMLSGCQGSPYGTTIAPQQTEASSEEQEVTTQAVTDKPTDKPTEQPTEKPTEKPTQKPEETTQAPTKEETKLEDFYDDMIAASFIQTGNPERVQKAIEKARNGEDVTIGYIGGSITEGANASTPKKCYAYLSYQYFSDTYGTGDNVHFVNAGMGGTTSALGVIRYERDIWTQGYTTQTVLPDIVFIEFAVNDGDDPTKGAAYESMIRTIYSAENQPAVILLFSVFESQWNLQDLYIPLGKAYDLPMISIKNAIVPRIIKGQLTNRQFFATDGFHPMDFGHQLMADCVAYCYQQIEKAEPKSSVMPETPVIGNAFENMHMIDTKTQDEGIVIQPGSFGAKDSTTGTYIYASSRQKMGDNWKHATDAGNEPFTMTLNCKSLILAYKLANSAKAGEIEIYIDGERIQPKISTGFCKVGKVDTLSGFSSGGWNNPWMAVLLEDEVAAEHTIEIRMAEGNEEKEFTLMGFGYSK